MGEVMYHGLEDGDGDDYLYQVLMVARGVDRV